MFPTYWSIPRLYGAHAVRMHGSLRRLTARIYKEFPFDAIVGTWAYPDAVAAARLARDYGVPFVAKIHGSDINELVNHPSIRRQVTEAFISANRIIAVSSALKDRTVEIGIPEERVLVQRNAVDGERFQIRDASVIRARLGLPLDRKLICFVGRLSPEKGADLLLDAFAGLVRSGLEDGELVIVGGGAENAKLQARARDKGIEPRIHFKGMRPPTEIPDFISACDILCLPSRREGCPNVVLEALASGKPVVACNVGGVPELLNERNGVIVQPESPDALAEGIKQALIRTWDPQSLRNSVEFLSWNKVAERLFEVLNDAVNTKQTTF